MLRASMLGHVAVLSALIVGWNSPPLTAQQATATAAAPADTNTKADAAPAKTAAPAKIPAAVLPVFSFNQTVLESPVGNDPLFGTIGAESLKDLVARLEKARDDDQVAGVVVLLGDLGLGNGQLEELYTVLRQVRSQGKPVYAHADQLTFGGLTLLSAASRISVSPTGHLFITGMYGSQLHVRDLLDKLQVTPDFLTCGAYKSAAEMYMRSSPSPEAERMYDWLFDSLFETYVGMIAEGREVPRETVHGWIDHGIYSAEKAAEQKVIDAVETVDGLLEHLRQKHGSELKLDRRYGKSQSSTTDLSNPFAVFKIWGDLLKGASTADKGKKPSVALVYVEGAILPGQPSASPLSLQTIAYSDPIRKALDRAAGDESIKAVVLRIDSPGGSAVGSEVILQATRKVAAKKPLVVSMGNVAGSGGYYVACGADTIIADAATVTASIGVVGGKLVTNQMWESVGVHWHPVQRGKHAGLLSSGDAFSDEQRQIMQGWMDEVYEVFKGHVVRNRGNRLTKPIDEIAGGRVYTGRQALELGLVDRLGTLSDALRVAAEKAGIQEYDVRVLPRPKSFVELLMADLMPDEADDGQIKAAPIAAAAWQTTPLWQAAAPLLEKLQPQQGRALRRALLQLEILQREQVTLAMPEWAVGP